jgi:hypothetical protein
VGFDSAFLGNFCIPPCSKERLSQFFGGNPREASNVRDISTYFGGYLIGVIGNDLYNLFKV